MSEKYLHTYANPVIQPDMSNYYRLHRFARARADLQNTIPDFETHVTRLYDLPAIKSFLQALPTKGIREKEDAPGTVTPGVIPRGIEISNLITYRKITIRNLFEQCAAGQPLQDDITFLDDEMRGYVDNFGLKEELVRQAAETTKAEAQRLKTRSTLRVISSRPPQP